MTKEELANKLNNTDYDEIISSTFSEAQKNNLAVIFGASDDTMLVSGSIDDECYCCNGDQILIDKQGFLPNFQEMRDDCEDEEEFSKYFARKLKAKPIKAIWCGSSGYAWIYETEIPHATFDIMEGNEKYCRGIVFSLDDLE